MSAPTTSIIVYDARIVFLDNVKQYEKNTGFIMVALRSN